MLANVYLAQGKLDPANKEDIARRIEIVEMELKAAVAANNLAWMIAEEKSDVALVPESGRATCRPASCPVLFNTTASCGGPRSTIEPP